MDRTSLGDGGGTAARDDGGGEAATVSLVRRRIIAAAARLMDSLPGVPPEPVSHTQVWEGVSVTILVGPVAGVRPSSLPDGRMYSDLEVAILHAIGPAGRLSGPTLAKEIDRPYDPTFKAVVNNLVDRGALDHDPGRGFAWGRRKSN